jgi:hypothetical protein
MLMDLAKALKAGTWSSQRYVEMTELFNGDGVFRVSSATQVFVSFSGDGWAIGGDLERIYAMAK